MFKYKRIILQVVWDKDEDLLKVIPEARQMRTALTSNPHHKHIGAGIDALSDAAARSAQLNVTGLACTVAQDIMQSWTDVCARGEATVVATFVLFMIHEKLPAISDPETRKAEVENVLVRFGKTNRTVSDVFIKAMRAV